MRMSSTADGYGTAVKTKFKEELPEIQHFSSARGQSNEFSFGNRARAALLSATYPRDRHACNDAEEARRRETFLRRAVVIRIDESLYRERARRVAPKDKAVLGMLHGVGRNTTRLKPRGGIEARVISA